MLIKNGILFFSWLSLQPAGEGVWGRGTLGRYSLKMVHFPLVGDIDISKCTIYNKKSVEHKSLESTVTFFIARIAPNKPFLPILIANFFSGDEAGDKVAFSPLNKTKSSVTITNDMGLYTAVIWLYCTRKTEFQDFRYSHNRLVPGSSPGWLTNKSASAVRRKLFS